MSDKFLKTLQGKLQEDYLLNEVLLKESKKQLLEETSQVSDELDNFYQQWENGNKKDVVNKILSIKNPNQKYGLILAIFDNIDDKETFLKLLLNKLLQ